MLQFCAVVLEIRAHIFYKYILIVQILSYFVNCIQTSLDLIKHTDIRQRNNTAFSQNNTYFIIIVPGTS